MITLPKLKRRHSATLSVRSFAIGIGVGILLVVVAAALYLNRGSFTSRADELPILGNDDSSVDQLLNQPTY